MASFTVFVLAAFLSDFVSQSSADLCSEVNCNFERNVLCQYRNLNSTKRWRVLRVKANPKLNNGRSCNAIGMVELGANENAAIQAQTYFQNLQRLRIRYLIRFPDVQLAVCCDDYPSKCNFQSNPNFDYTSVMWNTGVLTCPAGTEKIIIRAENRGETAAVAYIDDVELVDESGDPEHPYVSYCQPNVQRF